MQINNALQASYVLYHTEGCHLCELAAALLNAAQVRYTAIDICDDETLAERYGVSIPVVKALDERCLCWPFDATQLQEFLGA
ncbi:glutaredoxin family protein [Shewanella xiamenensis]|uniref:glutaredoxin family protein n=1 Tax=Shewanella xiamenensis TaxID=332186 RepID=UPI0024A786CF|nr:glutaredoxin family protein [Shewanella xiamenensis]MDI5849897.1 glutaredoxin family protein [Shewanella xiamenensis]